MHVLNMRKSYLAFETGRKLPIWESLHGNWNKSDSERSNYTVTFTVKSKVAEIRDRGLEGIASIRGWGKWFCGKDAHSLSHSR